MRTLYFRAFAVMLIMPVLSIAAEPLPGPRGSAAAGWIAPAIDLNQLIDGVARRTGKQFIVDPRVRAEIPLTGLDVERVDYARLLTILAVLQFVAIPSGDAIMVVPDANARQIAVPVTGDVPAKALDFEMVSLVVEAKNACAAQLVPVLRPMMPQYAHLAAFPQSNSLVLIDRAANARRIVEMVGRLDHAAPAGQKCAAEGWTSKEASK